MAVVLAAEPQTGWAGAPCPPKLLSWGGHAAGQQEQGSRQSDQPADPRSSVAAHPATFLLSARPACALPLEAGPLQQVEAGPQLPVSALVRWWPPWSLPCPWSGALC